MNGFTARFAATVCVAAAMVFPAYADTATPAPARELIATAEHTAARQKKAVMVIYHATWCGWCKRLDSVMEKPEFKSMFDRNYVVLKLDVMETGEKKSTVENPGGLETMKELGGEKSGLPFYVFLDAKGTKLADSNAMPENANIGYPGEPGEITAFMGLIHRTAPRWSQADQDKLKDYLVANAPKPVGAH